MSSTLPAPPPPASGGAPRPPQPSSSSSAAAPSSSTPNTGPHLLSLKVMRASAPSLAISEKPYYEPSPSDPLLHAVGQGISDSLWHDLLSSSLPGSSADDFPISSLLLLPNSFGTLFLGETFRTYLCVRNESASVVREPSLRVEMQVGPPDADGGARLHHLAHVILPTPTRYEEDEGDDEEQRPIWELSSGEPLETSLAYDIKDLGPHVLVCTVGYKSPLSQGDEVVWVERSFRKFYKFAVDRSPISVRTKVHHPRHAASMFHPDASVRTRVELEVQVQNVTGNGAALVLGGLELKPSEAWRRWASVDRPQGGRQMWKRGGSNEVLADGDVRQYLFVLTPNEGGLAEEVASKGIDLGKSAEGYAIRGDALGHLDISWRMSLGEAGRLQTSQLVRRRVVAPLVSVGGMQLAARLTLQAGSVERLKTVGPGQVVELDIDVAVCSVDGEDGEDDDTPLSEIASSPTRGVRRAGKRVLRLAVQHCSIELAPPPPAPLPVADEASTPRVPSRTSTPTQSALQKTRLQTNLSNLVRGGSLSLRASSRPSVDSSRAEAEESSRSATPQPPPPALPPKLESPVVVTRETPSLPAPTIPWHTLQALHKAHAETHAQALTRPSANQRVPESFLPTPATTSLGSSLATLPDVHLAQGAEARTSVKLRWLVADDVEHGQPVRFGALRLLLLSVSDEGGEKRCMTVLKEVPVIAESVVWTR